MPVSARTADWHYQPLKNNRHNARTHHGYLLFSLRSPVAGEREILRQLRPTFSGRTTFGGCSVKLRYMRSPDSAGIPVLRGLWPSPRTGIGSRFTTGGGSSSATGAGRP